MIFLILFSIIVGVLMVVFIGHDGIVPLFGLEHRYTLMITNLLWPIFGSIICALIFPRIIAPMYLAIKKYIMPDFKNGQTDIETKPYRLKKWFWRSIYVSLLVLGIQAFLVGFFPYESMLTPTDLLGYQGAGIDIRFTLSVTSGIVGLLTPIAVGVLSVGWALEDSGLIHYDLPKEGDRIYEVEPIFRRYISYIKGYAGLSSILFLVTIIFYFIGYGAERWLDAFFTMIIPFQAMLYSAFGYFTYVKTNTKFLRGRYPPVGTVTEDEIQT